MDNAADDMYKSPEYKKGEIKMSNHMILIGTEQIQSAANRMMEAAHIVQSSNNHLAFVLGQHMVAMETFINDMRDIMCPQLDKDGNKIS